MIGSLFSAYSPHGIASSIKKRFKEPSGYKQTKLEKSREPFQFTTQGQKFSQICCFHKTIVQKSIKKTFPEKSNDKTLKEI